MKLLRITNSQDIDPKAEFRVNFNEDIVINEFSKIGLISAQIPLLPSQVIVDDNNNQLQIQIGANAVKDVALTRGTYNAQEFADMVASVLNANIDGSDEVEDGAYVQTTQTNGILTLNYFKSGESLMTVDLNKNNTMTIDGTNDMRVPLGTNDFDNIYVFQNQPVQFTGSHIRAIVASKMNSPGANPVTYIGDCRVGIVQMKMSGTETRPEFVKFIGIHKPNLYGQFIKATPNGHIRIHVSNDPGAPQTVDYAIPGDVLSLEFGMSSIKYVVYRPINNAQIAAGVANDYVRIVLDEEPWMPDTNNIKYYVSASMLNRSGANVFYMSKPRVVNSPIFQLQGTQIINNSVDVDIHHDYNFAQLPALGYYEEHLENIIDDDNNPIVYPDDPTLGILPPVPVQVGDLQIILPSPEVMNLLGFDLGTLILSAPQGRAIGKIGYAKDQIPKSILVELMNINSVQSYDSTIQGRRNIVAVVPRNDLENNLLIYNPPVPLMINLNNTYKLSLRNLHFRLLTFNYSLVELNDTVDLVFVLE